MHKHRGVDAATRSALQELVTELCWKLDHGEPAGFSSLFEPQARIETAEQAIEGAAAIDAFAAREVASRRQTRHALSNHRLVRISDSVIEGTVLATAYSGDFVRTGVHSVVEHRDVYALGADATWRVRERRTSHVFEGRSE